MNWLVGIGALAAPLCWVALCVRSAVRESVAAERVRLEDGSRC